ncbi:MAG: RNA polymerase factor sigma-54, partial [Nitrospirota bacterium]|nr:RNA polymerase factor sigma-54 [Nitrospirota bacterium]
DEQPSYERTLTQAPSLADHLEWQLRLSTCSDREKVIGRAIIGNIDDDGYIRVPLAELASAMTGVAVAEIEASLAFIQQFDPPGVGARDLMECLLLQIRQLGLDGTPVEAIVRRHMPNLERKRYQIIAKDLKISVEKVIHAVKIIEGLEPKPGRPFFRDDVYYIIPDVYIAKIGEEYAIFLNEDGIPRLRTSNYYRDLVKEGNGGDPATKEYLDDRFRSAQWLIKSIEQRNKTIYRVAESILKLQRDFFDRGINYLKPMVLRDVAEDVGMHESTISRVTTNKYMHTPQGLFELKFFFSSGLQSSGEGNVSSVSVKEMLRKIVAEEDTRKPYNDQDIVKVLKSKGVDIARRTVVKYRSELNIPPSNMRKREF